MAPPKPPTVAALYVGRRELAMAAVGLNHEVLTRRTAPNPPKRDAAGAAWEVDTDHVWRWLVAALGSIGEDHRIEAVVPIAHAGTLALLDERAGAETLPLVDDGPLLPLLEAAAGDAHRALGHAQYWGFRLTGGAVAGEATSLGEASSLLEPRGARPTPALRASGRQALVPALLPPHEVLGRLAPEIAERAELATTTPVLVGAAELAARHGRLLAAGWERALLIVVDAAGCRIVGESVAIAPAMVGLDGRPLALLAVRDAGPVVRAPAGIDATALRGALVLDRALDQLGGRGPVVVEGPLARDQATLGLLAGLRAPHGQAVFAGLDAYPMAQAASLLWGLRQRRPPPRLDLQRVEAAPCPDVDAVKHGWRLAFGD